MEVLLEGVKGSGGLTEGRVRVILDSENIAKMERGDILVTKFTNPLFTPAILKASAVVTDTGGKLCHAAIVSRELGIPCVVGTEKGTKILEDGMKIIVDGEDGVIYGKE